MKLSNDQTKIMCELFEIPPEGADLITFFFTEEEIRFLLAVSAGEIRMPVPADTPGIDTAKEYRRGLLSKTDATGNFFRLNSFYGFLDVFCISNYEKYGSIIFLVGLAMPHYRLLIPSASLDMNLRQCFRVITPTATNSGTACFLTPRRTQAS